MTKYIVKEIHLTDGQVNKLAAVVAKQRQVSLKLKPNAQAGTLIKLTLTKKQINKYNRGKPFVLNLSATQMTAMSKQGVFFGPTLSLMARTLVPKILPVFGTLGLAAASGAISGATKKADEGSGIVGSGRKKIFV